MRRGSWRDPTAPALTMRAAARTVTAAARAPSGDYRQPVEARDGLRRRSAVPGSEPNARARPCRGTSSPVAAPHHTPREPKTGTKNGIEAWPRHGPATDRCPGVPSPTPREPKREPKTGIIPPPHPPSERATGRRRRIAGRAGTLFRRPWGG
ncbi:MAG: hypothetical protein KatS3mg056_2559 [Chloroflexus sp.]|nr:MAG: hypothetical protein KatS3mg056_2559 [Chloroflexus sp.]